MSTAERRHSLASIHDPLGPPPDGRPRSPFRVVLHEPEIPQNTGSIARLCAGARTPLHLVEPLGFQVSHAKLKRAGLDYWPNVEMFVHPDFGEVETLVEKCQGRLVLTSKTAKLSYAAFRFRPGDWLVFGKETKGLPRRILDRADLVSIRIPIDQEAVRSLNLANAASVVLYEALRQTDSLPGE